MCLLGRLSFGNLFVTISSHRSWEVMGITGYQVKVIYLIFKGHLLDSLKVIFIKLAPNIFCISLGSFDCKEQNLPKLADMKLSGIKYRIYKWPYNISPHLSHEPPSLLLSAHLFQLLIAGQLPLGGSSAFS